MQTIQLTQDEMFYLVEAGRIRSRYVGSIESPDQLAEAARRGLQVLFVRDLIETNDDGKVDVGEALTPYLSILNASGESIVVERKLQDGRRVLTLGVKTTQLDGQAATLLVTPINTVVLSLVGATQAWHSLQSYLQAWMADDPASRSDLRLTVTSGDDTQHVDIPASSELKTMDDILRILPTGGSTR